MKTTNQEEYCISCGEELPEGECSASKKPCGHHCECSWIQDKCCWCGAEFGEDGKVTYPNQSQDSCRWESEMEGQGLI